MSMWVIFSMTATSAVYLPERYASELRCAIAVQRIKLTVEKPHRERLKFSCLEKKFSSAQMLEYETHQPM